jgi:hypothetical protein
MHIIVCCCDRSKGMVRSVINATKQRYLLRLRPWLSTRVNDGFYYANRILLNECGVFIPRDPARE